MGMLVDGQWTDETQPRTTSDGRFQRSDSAFRDRITEAPPGRYHLYVNLGCPWAYRTVLYRKLERLEDAIPMTATVPAMGREGWEFPDGTPLHTVYTRAKADYTGRVSVPVLWDTKTGSIVNNESSEIIRMFDEIGDGPDYYPEDLRAEIDEINADVYENVNNGVYKAGFAANQLAHAEAVGLVFAALERLEDRLSKQRYLVGDRITEADWRLFSTLVRFDAAYYTRFLCNLRRLVDYPNLWAYTRDLYQVPGVSETVDLMAIKEIYFGGVQQPDPRRLIPVGPALDFGAPHDRDRF